MSAEPKASEPAPETGDCKEGYHKNKEGVCVPDEKEQAGESAQSAEKGLFPSVRAVIQEALDKTVKEMEEKMTAMMTEQLSKIQKEFATGLRKELGLSTDPTVTKTELNSAIRKAVLDLKLTDKKTPAGEPIATASPGTPEKPGDLFKSYGVN